MSFVTWADSMAKKTKDLSWLDMGLLKISIMSFALLAAKVWKPLLSLHWYWYVIIFAATAVKPLSKYLKK